jgi:hypothetical protein
MAPQARSRDSQSASPASAAYHTIYCGIATDREGKFDHFIRRVEISHKENGYWRFNSRLDEHRAYDRGFNTPEDLLCSVNSGDGTYEDITLRWQPGQADTNMQDPRIGCAAQHLKNIFDARYFLNKTLALRGRMPIYPADVRLEGYWKPNLPHPAASAVYPAVVPTAVTASSPLVSARVPSPVVGAYPESQRTPSGSPIPQSSTPNAFTRSFSNGAVNPLAQNPSQSPYRNADSPRTTNGGSTPSISSHMPTLALQSLRPTAAQESRSGNLVRSHYSPQEFIAQAQPSPLRAPVTQNDGANGPQRHQATLGRRISTAHPIQLPERNSDRPVQPTQSSRTPLLPHIRGRNVPRPTPITRSQYSSPYGPPPSTSYQSPFDGQTPPPTPLSGSYFTSQDPPVNIQAPNLRGGATAHQHTPNKTPHNQPCLADRPQCAIVEHTPAPSPESLDEDSEMPISAAQELGPNSSDIVSHTVSSENTCMTPQYESPVMPTVELPSQQVKCLKRPVEEDRNEVMQNKKLKGDTSHGDSQAPLPKQVQSSVSITDICQDLPCMDCGEDVGHKSDCYIGSKLVGVLAMPAIANRVADLKPMENLTFLDYRTLADCARYHDPGPWTDHQGPPREPAREDPEIQLQGMADVIRNEECYKNDTELHSLPNDFMITLWALKTGSDTEVVCE